MSWSLEYHGTLRTCLNTKVHIPLDHPPQIVCKLRARLALAVGRISSRCRILECLALEMSHGQTGIGSEENDESGAK